MLPITVLRRFDCVLALNKDSVLRKYEQVKDKYKDEALDATLNKAADQRFHNHSPLDFEKLKGDPDNIDKHLVSYINGFSSNVRKIFEYFEFEKEIEKMQEANILYLVVSKLCDVDLHPDNVPNEDMGLIFENLIHRFNELANETAGDHFTPREVIRLMVNILFIQDDKLLATPGTVRKLLDPACGTGGMLAEAQNYLRDNHPDARLYVYGQDYNNRAFAIAASDMLMKQVDHNGSDESIRFGDIFLEDQFEEEPTKNFDYFLSNPPFGVDWKKQQKDIKREYDKSGFKGRFGAGLPRINDGSLLFLQHMISKFEPVDSENRKYGSRLGIVFSGSPLFTGGAGSGESDIRKWIIEADMLEAIIALPEQMFYNTGIGTYVWIVTNHKDDSRKGKIQLVDAREFYIPMRRSLGNKRRKIGEGRDGEPNQIEEIVKLYGCFEDSDKSKIFDNADFWHQRVFNSVIVVTDRIVLDQQLQDTIYQFEHKFGVVQKIDKGSRQLAEALENAVPIVITTQQKFPFVSKQLLKMAEERGTAGTGSLPTRQCAVIIDEAHSSQGGDTATDLKGILGGEELRKEAKRRAEEEGLANMEELFHKMAERSKQANLSFFAFTATPKHKTLSIFGRDGKPAHRYTMRQAIEEGFILTFSNTILATPPTSSY